MTVREALSINFKKIELIRLLIFHNASYSRYSVSFHRRFRLG